MTDGVPIKDHLKPGQEQTLNQVGRAGDYWRPFLDRAGGDPKLAETLETSSLPSTERPRLKGGSLRIAAQRIERGY